MLFVWDLLGETSNVVYPFLGKEFSSLVGIATNWTMSIEQEWLFLKHARYSGALLCNKGLWHNKSALSVACIR